MPTISMFYGILIKMFFDDHAPPHNTPNIGRSIIWKAQNIDFCADSLRLKFYLAPEKDGTPETLYDLFV